MSLSGAPSPALHPIRSWLTSDSRFPLLSFALSRMLFHFSMMLFHFCERKSNDRKKKGGHEEVRVENKKYRE